MAKKIRLIDEEKDLTESGQSATIDNSTAFSSENVTQLMKLAEAIDWKLWEMLKLMKKFDEEK